MFSILPDLIEILMPLALLTRLLASSLITLQEFERLSLDSIDDEKRSRTLLVSILPRKGPDSFDRFLNVLKETEGQEHVAQKIIGTAEKKRKHNESTNVCSGSNGKIRKLERELKKEKMTVIGFRNKVRARLFDYVLLVIQYI